MTPAARPRFPGVDGVLFDYGMTLVHFERPVAAIEAAQQRIRACIAAAGIHAPSAAILTTAVHDRVESEVAAHEGAGALEEIDVGALEERAFADLGLVLDATVLDRCSAIAQEAWWDGIRLYPDTLPTLEALRARGLRTGVCSNAPYRAASMRGQLHHVGLDRHLDAAVFSSEVGWRKPSPRIFSAALEALGVAAPRAVFVGDRVREDVDGASAMGMRTVLVARDDGSAAWGSGADAVIRFLSELPPLLGDAARA